MPKWQSIHKKISLMEKPELGAATVLNEMEKGGRELKKWDLCRVVKELRKFKRHKQALEVYEWMNKRGERFIRAVSDVAIQIDLVSKVRGVPVAEEFFFGLPDNLKDRRVYGALLNGYVRMRMKDKAESLFETMRVKGYAMNALPFNVMMTLYMHLKDYEKVDALVEEMKQRKVSMDLYSYNIWISSCGSRGSAEKMEEVYDEMKANRSINPNWSTHTTMATLYYKMGLSEKAVESLKRVESTIVGRDRVPYHFLLSLYGTVGMKEEVYRVWNVYKSVFSIIPNMGYHPMISTLIRVEDIEGAEKIYEEWLAVKSAYDPKIANLLMGACVKVGDVSKAEILFHQMVEDGGKPNASSWEILAEGQIKEKRLSDALSSLKKAFAIKPLRSWKPKASTITAFFDLCEEDDDNDSREVLVESLRQLGFLKSKGYASLIGLPHEVDTNDELISSKERTDEDESDGSEAIFDFMQSSA